MRDIKFRVWDEQFKRMCKKPEQIRLNIANGNVHGSRSGGNVETWKLMQFTGLKDVNGVEIYEGDILEEDNQRFLVVFDKNWAKFKLQHGKVVQHPEWNRGVMMPVIGNIYQHPELLNA